MIALSAKIEVNTKPVEKDMERVSYRSLSHAAASIRKDALASVIFSRRVKSWYTVKRRRGRKIKIVRVPVWVPSDPGKPVLTHKRESLFRGAYRYDADKTSAVVGPTASKLGQGMKVHERGGMKDGFSYPRRAVVEPALIRNLDRFVQGFSGRLATGD